LTAGAKADDIAASVFRKYSLPFDRQVLLPRLFIDYKTSMITDEDPLWGLLFY